MSSDPRQRLLLEALARLESGEPVDQVEGGRLEVKEDPSTRERHGGRREGQPRSNATADLVRDSVVTLANAEGGVLLLGVAEAGGVTDRFPGTPADGEWICERVWASTGEQRGGLRVSCIEPTIGPGARPIAFLVDPSPFRVPSRDNKFRQRVWRQTREIPPVELGTFSWVVAVEVADEDSVLARVDGGIRLLCLRAEPWTGSGGWGALSVVRWAFGSHPSMAPGRRGSLRTWESCSGQQASRGLLIPLLRSKCWPVRREIAAAFAGRRRRRVAAAALRIGPTRVLS